MGSQGSEEELPGSDTAPRLPHCAGQTLWTSECVFPYHVGLGFEPRDRITDLENEKLGVEKSLRPNTHVHTTSPVAADKNDPKHRLKRSG